MNSTFDAHCAIVAVACIIMTCGMLCHWIYRRGYDDGYRACDREHGQHEAGRSIGFKTGYERGYDRGVSDGTQGKDSRYQQS